MITGSTSVLPFHIKTATASTSYCKPCRSTARSCAARSPTRRTARKARNHAVARKARVTVRKDAGDEHRKIRALNDAFRTTLAGGKVLLTAGVTNPSVI